MQKRFLLLVCVILISLTGFSQNMSSIALDSWLVLGPWMPGDTETATMSTAEALLAFDQINPSSLVPRENGSMDWGGGHSLVWRKMERPAWPAAERHRLVYFAVYLETPCFRNMRLDSSAPFPCRVFLDGEELNGGGRKGWDLGLETGKHLLLLKTVILGEQGGVNPSFRLTEAESSGIQTVKISLDPLRCISWKDLLDMPALQSLQVSDDGEQAALILSEWSGELKKQVSWLEILSARDGRILYKGWKEISPRDFSWTGISHTFSFSRSENGKTSIHTYNFSTGRESVIASGIEHFAGYWWAPGGRYLVYRTVKNSSVQTKDYKLVREIQDRSLSPRQYSSLVMLIPSSGVRRVISDSSDDFSDITISPDGKKILLAKTEEDSSQRPYSRKFFWILSTDTLKKELLLSDSWAQAAGWSPDSRSLLFLGGGSALNAAEKSTPSTGPVNEYDTDLYRYDIAARQAVNLTRSFAPSVEGAFWSPRDKRIFLKVVERDGHRLYRLNSDGGSCRSFDLPVDVISHITFSNNRTALFAGSSPNRPPQVFRFDLSSGNTQLLKGLGEFPADIRWGKVERKPIRTPGGETLDGTLYYPPDFNPSQRYPCIVYYYGGTSPVLREFGGRYPKEWYAANGYCVYVVQPSGAVGYGPDFSARHVNDWGEKTSSEISAAVRELVRSHAFIDPARIGAMGASYGGFLTQYLATQTDRFAAFISHAGISSLASYWGAGDWGYSYSAVASALSFPWNRKDLYVGHSPLFMAERITKPLLLLHGENDNNVPPGESYQMFLALKLLGKETALVTFPGQYHFILERGPRERWLKTIIAWFDRWLKDQPEFWAHLYGDPQIPEN